MVKKVITSLDLSRASGPDYTLVVVLTCCEPELAELFNNCLNKSCFPYCWKVSLFGPVFKNVGEKPTAKNHHPVSLSVVCKISEKLVNNTIVDVLEKCGLFLTSSKVLGALNQLQILWQLYLIELAGLLTGQGLLKL